MRWFFILLSVIGVLVILKTFAPVFAATVAWTPFDGVSITYGLATVVVVAIVAVAKLEFG